MLMHTTAPHANMVSRAAVIPYIFENMLPMPARHGDMVSCAVLHPYTLRTMMHITAAHADMVSCGAVISYTGTQTSGWCHKRQGCDRKQIGVAQRHTHM